MAVCVAASVLCSDGRDTAVCQYIHRLRFGLWSRIWIRITGSGHHRVGSTADAWTNEFGIRIDDGRSLGVGNVWASTGRDIVIGLRNEDGLSYDRMPNGYFWSVYLASQEQRDCRKRERVTAGPAPYKTSWLHTRATLDRHNVEWLNREQMNHGSNTQTPRSDGW